MSTYAMHVAKTGLNSQQTKMQIIANNLANVNTNGFKSDRANFETLLYQIIRPAGEQTSGETNLASSFAIGAGTRLLNTSKQHTQGSVVSTDNALDIAIEGSGFFQVLMPDGRVGYTEMVLLHVLDGTMTTQSGYVVQPEIQIPEGVTQVNISQDGLISVQVAGQVQAEEIGQLTLADFANRQGLEPIGSFLVEPFQWPTGCGKSV